MVKPENSRNIRQIVDYEPHNGVFTLDDAGQVALVPSAFKLDDGSWVEIPDDVLPTVLERLGGTHLEACVERFVELTTAPVERAVKLQTGVYLVGLA